MRPNTIAAWSLVTVLMGAVAWGQGLRPAAEVLEPFVNEQTVVVAHGDLTKANVGEIEKSVWAVLEKCIEGDAQKATTKSEMHADFAKMQERMEQFTQAGGKDMYLVMDWANPAQGAVKVLIPFYGEDAGALMDWMDVCWPGQPTVEVVGKTVVVSLTGKQPAPAAKASVRPELSQAMESVGAAPLGVMLIPTDANRKMIEQMMPTLPQPIGGPGTVLTHGVKWASLAVELPPKLGAKLVIQSQDAAAAEALRGVIERGLGWWGDMAKREAAMANAGELVKPLVPTQQADRLTVSVGQADVDKFVEGIAPALRQARQRAVQVSSASNMRQILLAGVMYANDHKGKWAPSLQAIAAGVGLHPSVLTNPARPQAKPAYIYVQPADPNNGGLLVLYEAFDKWPGQVNVGFADGHVEAVRDEQQFQQLLKAAGK